MCRSAEAQGAARAEAARWERGRGRVPWVHRRIDIRRRTAPWPLSACSVDLKVAKGAAAQATDVGRRIRGELAARDPLHDGHPSFG